MQLFVGGQLLDYVPFQKRNLKRMLRDLTKEAEKWDLAP